MAKGDAHLDHGGLVSLQPQGVDGALYVAGLLVVQRGLAIGAQLLIGRGGRGVSAQLNKALGRQFQATVPDQHVGTGKTIASLIIGLGGARPLRQALPVLGGLYPAPSLLQDRPLQLPGLFGFARSAQQGHRPVALVGPLGQVGGGQQIAFLFSVIGGTGPVLAGHQVAQHRFLVGGAFEALHRCTVVVQLFKQQSRALPLVSRAQRPRRLGPLALAQLQIRGDLPLVGVHGQADGVVDLAVGNGLF